MEERRAAEPEDEQEDEERPEPAQEAEPGNEHPASHVSHLLAELTVDGGSCTVQLD